LIDAYFRRALQTFLLLLLLLLLMLLLFNSLKPSSFLILDGNLDYEDLRPTIKKHPRQKPKTKHVTERFTDLYNCLILGLSRLFATAPTASKMTLARFKIGQRRLNTFILLF